MDNTLKESLETVEKQLLERGIYCEQDFDDFLYTIELNYKDIEDYEGAANVHAYRTCREYPRKA